jgi:RNA polymerase sigma-70 factor (ECF subfamily)
MARTVGSGTDSQGAGDYPALVRAASAGDRAATEQLLMRAQEVAYRFSMATCGHPQDAEDVMQDALLKTYRFVSSIRQPDAFRTWLYRTVKNACLMRRRRGTSEPRRLLSLDELAPEGDGRERVRPPADPGRGPEQALADRHARRQVRRAFRRLPAPYRVVVFLREMEGLSTREAARILGISEANVKTRLRRAHLQMRKDIDR